MGHDKVPPRKPWSHPLGLIASWPWLRAAAPAGLNALRAPHAKFWEVVGAGRETEQEPGGPVPPPPPLPPTGPATTPAEAHALEAGLWPLKFCLDQYGGPFLLGHHISLVGHRWRPGSASVLIVASRDLSYLLCGT